MGPPQPLSAAGDGLGVPPAAFRGVRRAELGPAEGDEEAPRGIFKENMLEQQLLGSCTWWPHSAPASLKM